MGCKTGTGHDVVFEVLLVHAHEAKRSPISSGLVTLCSHGCGAGENKPDTTSIRRPSKVLRQLLHLNRRHTIVDPAELDAAQHLCACEKLRERKQRVDEDTLPDLRATKANNLSTKAIPNWNKGTTRRRQLPYCHLQWGLSTRSCKPCGFKLAHTSKHLPPFNDA